MRRGEKSCGLQERRSAGKEGAGAELRGEAQKRGHGEMPVMQHGPGKRHGLRKQAPNELRIQALAMADAPTMSAAIPERTTGV